MPVFESSRKVQVFGSSLTMTLPAMFVKANEVEKGSMLNVYYGLEGVLVISQCKDLEITAKCSNTILNELEEKAKTQNEDEG